MLKLIPIILLLSCSCGSTEAVPETRGGKGLGNERSELEAKLSLYRELASSNGVRNEHGFVAKCDSLLFSSLSAAAGSDVDISAAEDDGRWYRRTEKECYENERDDLEGPGSHSDISKDMYLGVLWATWVDKDKGRLERMIRYGKETDWKVGRGPVGSTFITFNLRNTIATMLKALDGEDHFVMRNYPMTWPSGLDGYQAHLQIIHILLRKKIDGSISKTMLKRIGEHYKRQPKNALFSFAYDCFHGGDFAGSIDVLLDEKYFPADRLPRVSDRSENYLWQRDYGDDWKPGRNKKKHDGIDFEFLAFLILEELKGA
jgi:hypothetical protein